MASAKKLAQNNAAIKIYKSRVEMFRIHSEQILIHGTIKSIIHIKIIATKSAVGTH